MSKSGYQRWRAVTETHQGIVDDHKGAVTKIANFLGL
jgi:hypothetical protein